MIERVASSVPALVRRIDEIEHETESIYLRLGTVFQTIKAGVDASANDAELTIRRILDEHRGGISAEAALRRSREFIEDATRFFEKAAHAEHAFMGGVEDAIASLSRLDDIIDRIRADSEEMELVSLNAMTAALKSGTAGRAFSVITDELKRLSGRTIQHADDLSSAGSSLLQRLATLQATLASLATTQSTFFQSARQALESGFTALGSEVDETAKAIRALGDEASRVRQPVAAIMQEVQLQDIIRQSLDHVRLSLHAAEPDDQAAVAQEAIDPAEERAFLAEITRLSATLLEDVGRQVCSSIERFREAMQGVDAIVASVESRRGATSQSSCADAGDQFDANARAYLSAKEAAMVEASAIADGVRFLDERFKDMYGILSRFSTIVMASRIETARNKALAIVSTTVTGMMELTERLATDVGEAGIVTRSFGKALATGMSDYLAGSEGKLETLRSEIGNLSGEFVRMSASRERLCEAEADFRPFPETFSSAVREAGEAVARVDSLAAELDAMRCELAAHADGTYTDGAQVAASSIHSERLKAIVDRFTIFAHKQTAARIARMDAGDDDSSAGSGDVTLF
jgi:hypothetical protein